MLTAAEGLIERSWGSRRNHVAHLIETAKLAVRGAIYAGNDLDLAPRAAAIGGTTATPGCGKGGDNG